MVSKASEDLPDPDRPVNTINRSRGRSRSMFLKLWVRAPRMRIFCMQPITIRPASRGVYRVPRGAANGKPRAEFLDERATIPTDIGASCACTIDNTKHRRGQ